MLQTQIRSREDVGGEPSKTLQEASATRSQKHEMTSGMIYSDTEQLANSTLKCAPGGCTEYFDKIAVDSPKRYDTVVQ